MNWKLRNGNPTASVVQTPYTEFTEIMKDATLGQKINMLPDKERTAVITILERFLDV